jgi:glycosyltransferase involved in cell wall biosynthesis
MKISILIPTLDNPDYVELVTNAFRKNTTNPFEILVFANNISKQMKELANKLQFDYFNGSDKNKGVAEATNFLAKYATGDIIFYVGDDVYCVPKWDEILITKMNPEIRYQYLTGVMFGPTHKNPMMHAPIFYGKTSKQWKENEEKFLKEWRDRRTIKQDIISILGPVFIRKELWDEIGGFDEKFYPGFGTDPDLIAKIYFAAKKKNVPYEFRGVCDCGMYHFECIGTTKIPEGHGIRRDVHHVFRKKWGLFPLELQAKLGCGKPID